MSKLTIIWAVMLLLSFAAATYFDGALAFCLFYFLLIVPLVCLLYILRQYSKLIFRQNTDSDKLVVGTPEHYRFELRNSGVLTYCYNIKLILSKNYYDIESLPQHNSFNLKPGELIKHDTYITCRYRGSYNIGVCSIKIPDFLNFFNITFKNISNLHVFVLPQIIILDKLKSIPEFDSIQENDSALLKDELDVLVRDYTEGDSLNHINWKSTARYNSLKTRLYTGIKHCKVSILVDNISISASQEKCLAAENKIMETAIALTRYFGSKDTETSVIYPKSLSSESCSLIHHRVNSLLTFERFYEEFSKLCFLPSGSDFLSDTEPYSEQIIDSSIIIIVVNEISRQLFSYAKALSESGKKVNIYTITDKLQDEFILLAGSTINILQITPDQDIREVV